MTVIYRRLTVFVFLAPQVSGLMQTTYLVQKRRLNPLFYFYEPKMEREFSPRRPQELLACKTPTTDVIILFSYLYLVVIHRTKRRKKRDIYMAMSTTMLAISCCAAADCVALFATLACAFAFAASMSRTSSTMCLFSRINTMRSTLLASMLLYRSPIRWASGEKLRSA